jgi:hypothetical protein
MNGGKSLERFVRKIISKRYTVRDYLRECFK